MLSVRSGSSGAGRSSGSGGASRLSRPRPSSSSTARGLRSWLPSRQSFAAAEAVTLGAIVTYDVLGGDGKTKLPRPAPIVATMGFFAALAAAGSASRTFEPVIVAVGWVLALSVLVTGQRGAGILSVFEKFTGYVGTLGGDNATPASAG